MNIKKIKKIDITPRTAYLAGVIIGDGNLSSSVKSKTDLSKDYRMYIDISDREYLIYLSRLIKSIIKTKTNPKQPSKRGNRIPRLYLQIRNKDLFYFFYKEMEIPRGKKSSIVFVPSKINNSSKEIKRSFLAGYFDTDGGFRGHTLGFTTASKKLQQGLSKLLSEFKITHSIEEWINKKYDKEFYGIRISKKKMDKFLKTFPLQNKEKLIRIYKKFYAGMPEWSNGIDYSNQLV